MLRRLVEGMEGGWRISGTGHWVRACGADSGPRMVTRRRAYFVEMADVGVEPCK